jgi:hypothetical protein
MRSRAQVRERAERCLAQQPADADLVADFFGWFIHDVIRFLSVVSGDP